MFVSSARERYVLPLFFLRIMHHSLAARMIFINNHANQ